MHAVPQRLDEGVDADELTFGARDHDGTSEEPNDKAINLSGRAHKVCIYAHIHIYICI